MTCTTPTTTDPVAALKERHRTIWASGDYPSIAEQIADAPPADAVAAAGVVAGERVLDVATGNGNAALVAAGLGADVTGLDLVASLLDDGRRRAAAAGLDIQWDEGDAEALPYEDGAFDRVLSVFGIQFAPRHQVVADELVRVVRPGGTIALVNWTPDGLIGRMLKVVGGSMPKPPAFASPPPKWGDEDHVRVLFAPHGVEVEVTRAFNPFRAASAEALLELFEERYGPVLKAREALAPEGRWEATRAELLAHITAADVGRDGEYCGPSEYVVVTVRR